ncbi:MAG: HAD-IA family hydrolase [Dokdonella sp.]
MQYVTHYMAKIGDRSEAFPGARECLSRLRDEGFRLGVVTNALQKVATSLLARFELLDLLDIVVGGDQVAHNKPHPEHVLAACRALDVRAPRTLFVGDSNNDVLAARAAQVDIVGVPHGYNEGQSCEALGCPLVASLIDLPEFVRMQRSPALAT